MFRLDVLILRCLWDLQKVVGYPGLRLRTRRDNLETNLGVTSIEKAVVGEG